MSKGRILVVEDDADISNMLRIYFSGQGYDVQVAPRGTQALAMTRQQIPHLIVLDIMLPDMDGYSVCKELRTTTRTSHIPIIFLTQRDERSDKIAGLELGADDYITKPFDIEELRLRVQGAIRRSERESLTDPISGLPAGKLIENELRRLVRSKDPWAYMDLRLNNFDAFNDVYGSLAGHEVLRFVALLINEVVEAAGTTNDFIGHAIGDNFIIATTPQHAPAIQQLLLKRFNEEIASHYAFPDRQRGHLLVPQQDGTERKAPFMTLAIGVITNATHTFADIREITEMAAEARRQGSAQA
jgi:DNA-binding response OmpR family regulator